MNSIQIDKTDSGYIVSYNTDAGQVVQPCATWNDVGAYRTDGGFAPVQTT